MLILYLNANAVVAMIFCGLTIAISILHKNSKGNVIVRRKPDLIIVSMASEPLYLGPRRILPA